MVVKTRTIKRSRLYRNAELYHDAGFDYIPHDEIILYNQNERNKITQFMRELSIQKNIIEDIKLRPFKKGRREPIAKVVQ